MSPLRRFVEDRIALFPSPNVLEQIGIDAVMAELDEFDALTLPRAQRVDPATGRALQMAELEDGCSVTAGGMMTDAFVESVCNQIQASVDAAKREPEPPVEKGEVLIQGMTKAQRIARSKKANEARAAKQKAIKAAAEKKTLIEPSLHPKPKMILQIIEPKTSPSTPGFPAPYPASDLTRQCDPLEYVNILVTLCRLRPAQSLDVCADEIGNRLVDDLSLAMIEEHYQDVIVQGRAAYQQSGEAFHEFRLMMQAELVDGKHNVMPRRVMKS